MSRTDRQAISWLKANSDKVTVCDCDKNLGVAIFDTEWVSNQLAFLLKDAFGILVQQDFSSLFSRAISKLHTILDFHQFNSKVIDNRTGEYLRNGLSHEHIGRIRLRPKIHKDPIQVRPIISLRRNKL